jgi:hypothetical protein
MQLLREGITIHGAAAVSLDNPRSRSDKQYREQIDEVDSAVNDENIRGGNSFNFYGNNGKKGNGN